MADQLKHWFLIINSLLVFGTSSFSLTTFDPLTVGIGARALGMGGTYVAVSDTSDSIFTNPAGLGKVDAFEFTSMSGQVLEEAGFTILGGTYPLGGRGAIGLGYALASVGDIDVRNSSGFYIKKAQYASSVMIVSYGREVSDRFSLGTNLKYYSQDGTEYENGDGSAVNLDVGLLQKGGDWLSFGIVGQNLLGSSRVRYKNGREESLPSQIKVGASVQVLGHEFESAVVSPVKLTAALDADLSLQQTSAPAALHGGLEFSPNRLLTLRTGSDQNGPTYGVSLRWTGVGFHYAFQTHASYFALSFNEQGWPVDTYPDFKASDCQKTASMLE